MSTKVIRVAVYGNCQAGHVAQFLSSLLRADPSEIRYLSCNSKRTEDEIRYMHEADLLLEQITLGILQLDPALRPKCGPVIRFPFLALNCLWPYEAPHPKNEASPYFERGPYPYESGNMFINKMLVDGYTPQGAIERWRGEDLRKLVDLDRLFSVNRMMMKRIGTNADFCLWDEAEKVFREERLFWTATHASAGFLERLLLKVLDVLQLRFEVNEILAALGEIRSDTQALHVPLHPQVIEHFGLKWCDDSTKYRFYDEDFYTYGEYLNRYAACSFDEEAARGVWLTRRKEDLTGAERLLDAALTRHPASPYLHHALAQNRCFQGRTEEALGEAKRAVELAADVPTLLQNLFLIQRGLGLASEAAATLQQLGEIMNKPLPGWK